MATLTGTTDRSTANVTISSIGLTDWWHPVDNVPNAERKSGGGSLISTPTAPGGFFYNGSYDTSTMSWVGGTPTASGGDIGILFTVGSFTWTVPADTNVGTLDCYFNALAADGSNPLTVTATLSDGSAGPYTDNITSDGDWNVHITFQAASAGQTLTIVLSSTASVFAIVRGIGLSVAASPATGDALFFGAGV